MNSMHAGAVESGAGAAFGNQQPSSLASAAKLNRLSRKIRAKEEVQDEQNQRYLQQQKSRHHQRKNSDLIGTRDSAGVSGVSGPASAPTLPHQAMPQPTPSSQSTPSTRSNLAAPLASSVTSLPSGVLKSAISLDSAERPFSPEPSPITQVVDIKKKQLKPGERIILSLLKISDKLEGEQRHTLLVDSFDQVSEPLKKLWAALFDEPMEIPSEKWLSIGFKNVDPIKDVNSIKWGYICLLNLSHFAQDYPTISKSLVKKKNIFQLASVVFALTQNVILILNIQSGAKSELYEALKKLPGVDEPLREVVELAVLLYERMWRTLRKECSEAEVVEKVSAKVREYLNSNPSDLDDMLSLADATEDEAAQ